MLGEVVVKLCVCQEQRSYDRLLYTIASIAELEPTLIGACSIAINGPVFGGFQNEWSMASSGTVRTSRWMLITELRFCTVRHGGHERER
jgi:hypothetical protein